MLLADKGKIDSYSKDSLTIRKNLKTYKYTRLKELPISCRELANNPNDPVYNFEVLWNTFNEQFCYFEERKIDWNVVYKRYRPRVTNETIALELHQIFDEILTSFNDGHVDIETPDYLAAAINNIKKSKKSDPNKKEQKVNKKELELKTRAAIPNFYCKDLKSHNAGWANWGMMKDDIAYIQVNAMMFLAFYDIPTGLSIYEWWPLYMSIAEKERSKDKTK